MLPGSWEPKNGPFSHFLKQKRNSRLTLELGIETGGLSRWPGLELVPFAKTAGTVGYFL